MCADFYASNMLQSISHVHTNPFISFCSHSVKAEFANLPLHMHVRTSPARTPNYSPPLTCKPTLLFPEAHRHRGKEEDAVVISLFRFYSRYTFAWSVSICYTCDTTTPITHIHTTNILQLWTAIESNDHRIVIARLFVVAGMFDIVVTVICLIQPLNKSTVYKLYKPGMLLHYHPSKPPVQWVRLLESGWLLAQGELLISDSFSEPWRNYISQQLEY